MFSDRKVLIASGSRHTIPPLLESPGVARIIYQLSDKVTANFNIRVISKYDKILEEKEYNREKYLHPRPKLSNIVFEHFLKVMPYRWKKRKYGFTQPDRIIYYKGLVSIAKRENPEVIITFMHFELFKMLQKALPQSKHIFFFRSTDLKGRIGEENINYLIKNSAGFLANTKAPIAELKTFDSDITFPMTTIYNAVPEVNLTDKQQSEIGTNFREKFGLSKTDFVLGYAGRFSEEKSLKELFEVINKLKDQGIIVHLIIAGDINNEKTPNHLYYEELINFKNQYIPNQIHFAGWITNADLYHFYCALDIGILLSKYREGNSMFLIEAMSYGVPVIATAIGGNSEIITNGYNGFLVEVDAIRKMLESNISNLKNNIDKRKLISSNARTYIVENHSNDTMVERFSSFISKVY